MKPKSKEPKVRRTAYIRISPELHARIQAIAKKKKATLGRTGEDLLKIALDKVEEK